MTEHKTGCTLCDEGVDREFLDWEDRVEMGNKAIPCARDPRAVHIHRDPVPLAVEPQVAPTFKIGHLDTFLMNPVRFAAKATLYDWSVLIYEWAETKGWNEKAATRTEGEWAALVHTEISEAFEEFRSGHEAREIYFSREASGPEKPEGMPIEYADALIRILHWFAFHKINPIEIMQLKMSFNLDRPYLHGGKIQ